MSSLWSGFSGSGDPVVLYDQLVDRWVITKFAIATGGTPNPLNSLARSPCSASSNPVDLLSAHDSLLEQ